MRTFISTEEAWEIIRDSLPVPVPQMVPLSEVLGRTVLDEVISKEAVPPFANSAMDGFAVLSTDLQPEGGVLKVIGEVRAGAWPDVEVLRGTCMEIMTGAPMPEGADAVVPVEWTTAAEGEVSIDRGVKPGRHVRLAGQDMEIGDVVLPPGARVGSAELSALVTAGLSEVRVGEIPAVAVISTGDELVAPGHRMGPGQIRNSNGPALAARVLEAGARVIAELHAIDVKRDIVHTIRRALKADVLVFSGGVSMGKYDLVQEALEELGFQPLFWKVKQRPGKPLAFGLLDGRPVFGLPGNPVSAAICFDQYVRPALTLMQGGGALRRPRWLARIGEAFPKPPGLHVYARGIAVSDGPNLTVRPAGAQGSNISMSLVRANCIVHLPSEWDDADTGRTAEVEFA
ncbi:MAG: molybdopterin molybdotransferase [Rhodothermales bacterium]|jgi:molybdopterin molybdotransferase